MGSVGMTVATVATVTVADYPQMDTGGQWVISLVEHRSAGLVSGYEVCGEKIAGKGAGDRLDPISSKSRKGAIGLFKNRVRAIGMYRENGEWRLNVLDRTGIFKRTEFNY